MLVQLVTTFCFEAVHLAKRVQCEQDNDMAVKASVRDRDALMCDHGSIARMLHMRLRMEGFPDPTDKHTWYTCCLVDVAYCRQKDC